MNNAANSRKKVGVLISGRGSNLEALIKAAKADDYPAEIVLVISNKANAGGLELARAAGIACLTVDHKAYDTREDFEDVLTAELEAAKVEIVCNAGFLRLLTARFTDRWHNRHLNIHPSLLPAYKGLHSHERAIDDGVRISGCTVHIVRQEMDAGPIIAQAAVPVFPNDDADSLAARVLETEHQIYPHALAMIASGSAKVIGERVENGKPLEPGPLAPLFSPPVA